LPPLKPSNIFDIIHFIGKVHMHGRPIACKIAYAASVALAAALAFTTPTAAQLAPVPAGFHGTAFRGIALGQARAEVEAILGGLGLRCYSPEEVNNILGKGRPPKLVEEAGGFKTCRIVDAANVKPWLPVEEMMDYGRELRFGAPFYAVSFVEGIAAALTFSPSYFNAAALEPRAFAQSIADNYPLVDGLTPTQGGWQGLTSNGELISITVLGGGRRIVLGILPASKSNTPSFD
jgi:hypothetical protein